MSIKAVAVMVGDTVKGVVHFEQEVNTKYPFQTSDENNITI